jgi:hypothetical protein
MGQRKKARFSQYLNNRSHGYNLRSALRQADLLIALTPLNLKRWPMKTTLSKKFDGPRYQIFSASFRGAVFGPPHSRKACVELYISNGRIGRTPRMRKGCRAHIRRKVVVRDDAVMALQSSKFAW